MLIAMGVSPRRRRRSVGCALLFLAVALISAVVFFPGPLEATTEDYRADVDDPLSPRALDHYRAMRAHFEEPFEGYGRLDVFTPAFAVVLLSNVAIGFMNVADAEPDRRAVVAASLEEVTRRALSAEVSPYHRDPRHVRALGDENLYLSHLSLVLGARRRVVRDDHYDELHLRINRHLARRSLLSDDAHARSYPGSARFPADQAATLAALHLYDLEHGTSLAERPVARWLAVMRGRGTHPGSGLFRSSMTPSFPHAREPRGCAVSWSTLYLAQFAPDVAREQYARYRGQFLLHVGGLGGFREYREGVDARMDVDSGPIVLGMGVAATGFGVGAARIMGDREAYRAIMRTAATVGVPDAIGEQRTYRLSPMLGEAILFHGMTARRWDGEPIRADYEGDSPFPAIPTALVLFWLAVILLNLRWAARRLSPPA